MLALEGDSVAAARALVGWEFLVDGVGGVIVEVEAYRPDDPASHAFRERPPATPRCSVPRPPVRLPLVWHPLVHQHRVWAGRVGLGGAGASAGADQRVQQMIQRRGVDDLDRLCRGPGNVGRALGAGPQLNGAVADLRPPTRRRRVATGTRIGLSVATERRWRFGDRGSRSLSRPLR